MIKKRCCCKIMNSLRVTNHLMTVFLIRVWPVRSAIIKQVWQICMINLSYSVYIHVFRELKGSHSLRQRKSHVHALCPQNAEAKRSSWKFHKNEQGVTFIVSWLSKILLYFLRTYWLLPELSVREKQSLLNF